MSKFVPWVSFFPPESPGLDSSQSENGYGYSQQTKNRTSSVEKGTSAKALQLVKG